MAMTVGSVLFVLAIAVLASMGLLRDFGDAATSLLLGFVGATFWGVGGIAAFSAYSQAWTGSRPMAPLAYLSVGMALLVAVLTLYEVATTVRRTSGTTEQTPSR